MRPILPPAVRPFIPSRRRVRLRMESGLRGAVALLLLATVVSHPAAANPQGGTVTDGAATITTPSATTTQITQSTSKAVIDWQSFSVGSGETTRFVQPSSDSITLNRVVGGNASEILGHLTANGQVWLVNPNGIFFGSSATVDVAGLLATTQDIRNADFMAGHYSFHAIGNGGYVVNEGAITVADTGLVGLVAPYVANRGVITARLGEVALGSGTAFTVDFYGDQLINMALDQKITAPVKDNTGKTATSLVENSGKIFADGGRVTMTAAAARGVVDKVIDTSGVVQANSVVEKNGEIFLLGEGGSVEVSGSLQAAGASAGTKGGAVVVTGDTVTVKSAARVNVSGTAGGGQTLIGGDVQGGKASASTLAQYGTSAYRKEVPTAKKTTVETGAVISADATANGKGGKVVVWADEDTLSYGTVTAKGGPQGGDGGFIETSGKVTLAVGGAADASAPVGVGGYWLLDPTSIVVVSSVTSGGSWSSGTFSGTGISSNVSSSDINDALNGGTSVILDAVSGGGGGTGAITVSDPITKTSGGNASLTLSANSAISINQPITSTCNALNLVLETSAASTISIAANITTNGGTLSAGGTGSTSAALISLAGGKTISAGAVTLKATTISLEGKLVSSDNVTLTGTTITETTMASGANGGIELNTTGGTLTMTADTITLNGDVSTGASTSSVILKANTTVGLTGTMALSGGSLTIQDDTSLPAVTVGSTASLTGVGDFVIRGSTVAFNGAVTNSGNVSLQGGTSLSLGASSTVSMTGSSKTLTLQSDDITLSGGANSLSATGTSDKVKVTSVTAGKAINLSSTTIGGALNLSETGLASISTTFGGLEIGTASSGTITVRDDTVSSGNGTFLLPIATTLLGTNLAIDTIGGGTTLAVPAGDALTITLADASTFTLDAATGLSAGSLTLKAGAITINGTLAETGAANGKIELGTTSATGNITISGGATLTHTSAFDTILKSDSSVTVNNNWDGGTGGGGFTVGGYSAGSYPNVNLGGTIKAGSASIEGGSVTISGGADLTTEGAISVASKTGGIYVSGTVESTGGNVSFSTANNQIFQTTNATIIGGADHILKVQADVISLGVGTQLKFGTDSTTDQAILEPTQATTVVRLATGTTDFNLTSTELGYVTATRLTIGKTNGAAMYIGDSSVPLSTFSIPANVTTLELSGTSLTFAGNIEGADQNLWINAFGGNVSFAGTIGAGGRLGELKIDPPAAISAQGLVTVDSLSIIGATGNVSFSPGGLNALGGASISTTGSLSGAFTVGGMLTINAASSNITGTWVGFTNNSTGGTHTANGSSTVVGGGGGGGGGGTTTTTTTTTPTTTTTTAGGTTTTTAGGTTTTTTGGTTTTTTGGTTTTTTGGTTTTTTGGATTTTTGGTTTTTTGGTTTLGNGDIITQTVGGQLVIQQVSSQTGNLVGSTITTSGVFGPALSNGPLSGLQGTSSSIGSNGSGGGQEAHAVSVPLDDSGVPAYSSSGSVNTVAVQTIVVEFKATMTTNSAVDAVASLAAKSLSNSEVRAVFDAMPTADVVSSLTNGGSTLGQRIGGLLQETLAGGAVTYADVKGVLDSYGADSELARTYLSLFQRVQKEARADLFAAALDQLRQNPDAADVVAPADDSKGGKPQFTGVRMSGMTPQGLARVEGKVQHSSPFVQLRVNGRWVFVDETGAFRADVAVQAGHNEVALSVVDEEGDRSEQSVAIDAPTTSPPDAMRQPEGRRIALMFATHDYRDPNIPKLMTPKADANLVAKTLRDRMGYETRMVDNGTKGEMIEALKTLGHELTENDNVIVYYAGHGFALQETGNGYWLPVDAKTDSPAQWISNRDVSRLLHRMPAKHILLVADSCYSGAFTKEQAVSDSDVERDPQALMQRRSVMAMSSGGDEPVLDGDVNSPFASALVGQVTKLQNFEPGVGMFHLVHDVVVKKTPQTPQYGAVRFAGYDAGGDYLFNRSGRKTVAGR